MMVIGLKFRKYIYVAKTKALSSCTIIAQLICAFVFTYAYSDVEAHIYIFFSVMKLLLLVLFGVAWAGPRSIKDYDLFQDPFSKEMIDFINKESGAKWKV